MSRLKLGSVQPHRDGDLEIMIRDGRVVSSACQDCSTDPYTTKQCKQKIICNDSWTRFYSSIAMISELSQKFKGNPYITKADITDFANFYDPFVNGLISNQCVEESMMDVRLRSNKNDIGRFLNSHYYDQFWLNWLILKIPLRTPPKIKFCAFWCC